MSGAGLAYNAPVRAVNALQGLTVSGGHNEFIFASKESSSLDQDEGTYNVHWKVPRRINTLFTGRTELLNRIKDAMQDDSQHDKVFVITGLGGLGKSEICLRIAHETRKDFWGVFWVDVSSPDIAKSEFEVIAGMLEKKVDGIEGACRLLANTRKRCLLIIDNADTPSFDYNTYLPPGLQGFIILTSRYVECQYYNTVGWEALSELDLESCKRVLLTTSCIPRKSWSTHEKAAEEVVNLLQSHTLALIQAGTYIARGHCELEQYPDTFRKRRKRLLEFSPTQAQSRYGHVYATFEASDEVLTYNAKQLLRMLSMFDHAFLPESLFRQAWEGSKIAKTRAPCTEPGLGDLSSWEVSQLCYVTDMTGNQTGLDVLNHWHVSQLLAVIGVEHREWDSFELNEAIQLLGSLSFITRVEQDDVRGITMHPLVHSWAKDRQSLETMQASWLATGSVLALATHGSAGRTDVERTLQPHVQAWVDEKTRNHVLCCTQQDIVALAWCFSWLLVQMRDDVRLDKLLQALFHDNQLNAAQPQDSYVPLYHLQAQSHLLNSRRKPAVELAKRVVEIRQATLEFNHPIQLAAEHLLALAYLDNGQTKAAIGLLEHEVAVRSAHLDETHLDRLSSWQELARAYTLDGQSDKAINLLKHVIAVQEEVLAPEHASRLASQHELAIAYEESGEVKKALELQKHVFVTIEKILAPEHPERIVYQHTLAVMYREDGQVQKAIALLESIVDIEAKLLEPESPERLRSQHELAVAYQADGQVQKAIALLETVVEVRDKLLEPEDAERLASQHALALAYRLDGQVQKAIALLESVVEVRDKLLEPGSPDRLRSQHELALAYRLDGQVQKAIALLESVVEVRDKLLEPGSPDRLTSQHELAVAYRLDGQVKKAIALLESVVEVRDKLLEPENASRLASQHELAVAYQADGQVQKAVELLEHVVAVEADFLRDDDPSRLISVEALADMYADLAVDDSDEASSSASIESPIMADSAESVMQQCD